MNKRKRPRPAWTIEWEQVYHSDREERLQRVFALIVPHVKAKTRRQTGEHTDAEPRRPLRQSLQ